MRDSFPWPTEVLGADSPSTVRISIRPRVHPFRPVSRHSARFKPCRCLGEQNFGLELIAYGVRLAGFSLVANDFTSALVSPSLFVAGWRNFVSPLGGARLAEQLLRTRHGGIEAETRNCPSANVMNESAAPTQRRILVPLDFSEAARVALKTALRMANKADDTVFLFYVPGLYRRTAQDREALVNPFRVNIPETYGHQQAFQQ